MRFGSEASNSLKVVNAAAERGVALIDTYSTTELSRDEEQLQFLLQIAHHHRAVVNWSGKKEELMKKVF